MTEIPEHLLKRSQAAKSKAAGEPAPADTGAAPAATPAVAKAATPAVAKAAAAPAPVGPPPVKPDPPYVAAAKSRKKIPFWAMATLSILPLWVFMYTRALTPGGAEAATPLTNGAEIYVSAACAGCHGTAGEGIDGNGYQFSEGEILKSYPHIEDQLRWVYNGSGAYQTAGVSIGGDPNRAGGAHVAGARGVMPGFGAGVNGSLTEVQILEVVCEERYGLGGGDETSDEFLTWCSPESEIWLGLEAGTLTFDNLADSVEGIFPVGTEPAPGHSADEQP